MVSLSSNNNNNVNITTNNQGSTRITSQNTNDVTANMNGNSQRAKSWAVGQGLIDGEDYSAKHYANLSKEIEQGIAADTNNAHIWAEGTDEEVEALGGTHSSKGWVNYVLTNPPTASVEETESGATITVTDINGTTTANIYNGQDGADGADGQDGQDGADGVSPTASVTKSGSTATITITDANGTTTTTISDGTNGTNGADGYSPTATVSQSGNVTTISITDNNGTTTESIDLSNYATTTDLSDKVSKSGDTMTGGLVLSSSSLYLTGVASTVSAGTSKMYFGTPSSYYVYIGANTSGNFGIYNSAGKGVGCYPAQCLYPTSNIDMGRSNNKWKDIYANGKLYGASSNLSIDSIISGANAGATAIQPNDNISGLTNDAGYITNSALSDYVLSSSLATVATTGAYSDLTGTPTIPSALSDITVSAGSNISISGDTISATDTTYSNFTGCDSITGGVSGLVPAPSAGDENKFVRANGTWDYVPFIPYFATSTTAADMATKEVSIPEITELKTGQIICVKPTITSTVATSKIKLNNFTAYNMRYNGANITTSTDSVVWNENWVSWFVFDGTYWQFAGHGYDNNTNTTYSAMSVSEGTTGTATNSRTVRADYLKQIIQGTKLTGLSTATNSAVVATDDILTGIGKLQAQINNGGGGSITVDQTYDGTSANAQSGVAIAGAGFLTSIPSSYLQNTATDANSLTINGTATTKAYAINLGYNSSVSKNYSVAIGTGATASGVTSMALGGNYRQGEEAIASADNSIQIGSGTNSTTDSLQVGSYQLLDTSTGLIPDARLSTNIARTSQIPTVPTNISSFNNDSGYITGITSSDVTTALGYTPADTDLSNLSATGKTVIDGQWISVNESIISSTTSLSASTALTKRITLPDDNHKYEVLIRGSIYTSSTSGKEVILKVKGNEDSYDRYIARCITRTSSSMYASGTALITASYVANDSTNLTIARDSGWGGNCSELTVVAYRRIGSNT